MVVNFVEYTYLNFCMTSFGEYIFAQRLLHQFQHNIKVKQTGIHFFSPWIRCLWMACPKCWWILNSVHQFLHYLAWRISLYQSQHNNIRYKTLLYTACSSPWSCDLVLLWPKCWCRLENVSELLHDLGGKSIPLRKDSYTSLSTMIHSTTHWYAMFLTLGPVRVWMTSTEMLVNFGESAWNPTWPSLQDIFCAKSPTSVSAQCTGCLKNVGQ